MSASHRLIGWIDARRDIAFDLIRIYLGVALFVRGGLLVADSSEALELFRESVNASFLSAAAIHYVALAHLGGGILLALGLLTRVAALVQIPILVGAVFFVHLDEGLLATGQSLELAALVLFLLVVITLHGSGRLSLDYYLFEREQAQAARATQLGLFETARRPIAAPVEAMPGSASINSRSTGSPERRAVAQPAILGCSCDPNRNRDHPRVRTERRYGMRALRFITGTTGTPREIVFRCRDCGRVVETSAAAEDIAYYTYR